MIMYAAAMGNTITAVFQCLSAISVNGFHFSESTHKNLHIRITVRFECIGDFIQPVGNLRYKR